MLDIPLLSGRPPFDFFVDSAAVDDTGNGLTPATAKKTLASAATLVGSSANKRAGLKSGSTFSNDTFVSSANGIYIGVYGGAAPVIIDCAKVIPAGSFTLAASQTKTYQASITVASTASAITFVTAFEDYTTTSATAVLTNVTSIAACEALAGSFYWADNQATQSGGAGTLYIHATDDSNPASNGKVYEYTNQAMAIGLTSTTGNLSVVGPIETRRQCHGGGSIQLAAPSGGLCTLTGTTARMGNRHNAIVTAPCVVTNNTFVDNVAAIAAVSTAGLFVINQTTGNGEAVTLSGNRYLATVPQTSAGACLSHTTSGNYGACIASNETMLATAGALTSGYAMANVTSFTVGNLTSTNVSQPIGPLSNTTINGGAMKGGTAKAAQVSIGADNITVTINSSIIVADGLSSNHGVVENFLHTGCTLNINDAVIYHGANGGSLLVGCIAHTTSGNTLNLNRTTLAQSSTPTKNMNSLVAVGAGLTYAGDQNTFADNSYNQAFYNNANETFAQWKTATSQDANSVETGYIASPL